MAKGKLYLIPCILGDTEITTSIPESVQQIINSIDDYIVEKERSARRYLSKLGITKPIQELNFYLLNKHVQEKDVYDYLNPANEGKNIGLLSEAGCPAIADPGAQIVKMAYEKGIQVVPLVGPSSIFLALMASGMNGQNFAFHGYLPIDNNDRKKKIRELDPSHNLHAGQTQIFIETPYRNQKMLESILSVCNNNTRLCIACDITLKSEFIQTKTIVEWKRNIPRINKRPVVFLLG
ncbi:MAG: SAM-dependent methyltransferase [Flavobacteriales bacterium]|nr:MAG: SAM-dependent methyltransferase [Flavobacteriales bacterium]